MRNIKSQGGFTIIEIMLVVAIIGILAAVVLPNARQYAIRAKMSEAMLATGHCHATITEFYLSADSPPVTDNSFGCESSGPVSLYVDSVHTTVNGVITVSLTGFHDLRIDTHDVTLAPLDFQGNHAIAGQSRITQWRCGSPLDGTTVPSLYLPGSCKGG
jgi:type IV pilus assembly protein PilA